MLKIWPKDTVPVLATEAEDETAIEMGSPDDAGVEEGVVDGLAGGEVSGEVVGAEAGGKEIGMFGIFNGW